MNILSIHQKPNLQRHLSYMLRNCRYNVTQITDVVTGLETFSQAQDNGHPYQMVVVPMDILPFAYRQKQLVRPFDTTWTSENAGIAAIETMLKMDARQVPTHFLLITNTDQKSLGQFPSLTQGIYDDRVSVLSANIRDILCKAHTIQKQYAALTY